MTPRQTEPPATTSTAFLDAIHADPWAESFLDLPSLNASASDAIEAAIRKARDVARAEPQGLRSSSLVVLGPPGAGKTHLFARLRRKLGPRAIFVHVRPLVHAEITPRFLLGEVVRQLGFVSHGLSGMRQVDAMVGSLLAQLDGGEMFFPSAFLTECEDLSDTEREARLDNAVERVLEIWQEVDESYLRRLLQVPFAKVAGVRRSMLAWLSGRDCDVTQLARIGATASLDEGLSLPALRTLAGVAAMGAPIVVVFDQLENLVDAEGPGTRLLSYANLTAELVDSTRGLVLVHMALDTEWSRGIEPSLNLSQRSRLLMARDTLALPTPKQREQLLELWSSQLPERASAFPWPFTEAQAQRLCHQPGVTPRMLLLDFRRALNGEFVDDSEVHLDASKAGGRAQSETATGTGNEERRALLEEWAKRLEEARSVAAEASEQRTCLDPSRLADGLLAAGRFLEDAKFSGVKGAESGQLRMTTSTRTARIAILHHGNPRSLGATLKKLRTTSQEEPVIAVRERAHELPPTWKDTLAKQSGLLATQRARWIWLNGTDAASLLALDSLLQGARSGDVSDETGKPLREADVAAWVSANLDIAEWPIIREILSTESSSTSNAEEDDRPDTGVTKVRSGPALGVLRRLRVASLDRVVREVLRVEPRASRASVIAELDASSSLVSWFGRTIVAVRVS